MKGIQKRLGSLCMAVVMLLSMAVTPAMAADTKDPPTEVTNCATSGFSTTVLALGFSDTVWMNAISTVKVGDEAYTKGTVSSFSNTGIWENGTYSFNGGAQGDLPALKFALNSGTTFPVTIVLSAKGYKDLTVKVTQADKWGDTYTAEAVVNSDSGNGGSGSTETPDTGKTAPTAVKYAYSSTMPAAHYFGADSDWLSAITGVQVNGTAYEKGSVEYYSSGNHWNIGKKDFNGYGAEAALVVLANSSVTYPAKFTITATDYPDVVIQVDKKGAATATIVQDTPAEYTVTAATDIENGTVKVSATSAKAGDTVTVTATPADGYELDTITVTGANGTAVAVNDSKFTMPAENVTVSAAFKEIVHKTVAVSDIVFGEDRSGSDWYVTFGKESDNYINAIKGVSVNGKEWKSSSTTPYTGGSYCKYNYSGYMNQTKTLVLAFAKKSYISSGTDVLKSGDVITIMATGYKDLTFKLVIDTNGKASVAEDDGRGDPYELHVKIEGSFEAAIVGQKNYDGVSSASTGGASSNKNSAVTVYGALVQKGAEPADSDWQKLESYSSKIKLVGSKCKVNIMPDASKGMTGTEDSGMKGVYMTLSSDLTLNGTPKDAGSYLISIHVEDNQGRTADSNELPFRIYTGEETLADQLKTENLKKYESSGLYAWDIMEPWAIKNFGSNVTGEENSVRVPKDLEVWFGSHTSGTYGFLGYDIPWKQVKAGDIPQTLYIPRGCNLTLTNMEILSSVRIVVEDGGKLTLSDSVVQGIIDVKSGGTFSMNYDAFNKKFTTGASICGQLRMESGSTLENAAIYSHTNYLANGDLTDRSNDEAVVLTTGDVTVKGQVFIRGDDAGGTEKGQTALKVKDGTLTLGDGAVLAAYGGDGKTLLYPNGGSAIELDNGTISGNGKVIALGGSVLFGSGSSAVSGTGTITTTEAYIQGATAYEHNKNAQPGKSHDASVSINSNKKYVANGTLVDGTNDPLADLYWKSSIDATPDLSKYEIPANSGYVLMNIPYAEFYAAEKDDGGNAAKVDAVSSATLQKTRSTLAAGSYHKNPNGSDISGVIYPVYVADLSALHGYKQVKDSDTRTITVTLKGKEIKTTYTGKNALFENPDYAYYVLSEVPTSYKTLTVEPDGSFSFGKTTATMTKLVGTSVSLKTGSRHTYYKLKVSDGLPEDIASMVSAVTLHTKEDNKTYGLRHVAEIWRGTELGFEDTGVYAGLQGKTIDTITYYLNNGKIQTIAANIKVPKSTKNVTATVENALNTAREAVVTVKNLPADFVAEYTVTSGSTVLSAYNFTVANGKLTWTGTPAFGAYTLTITDKSGAYAPVLTSFELKTADVIAKYDASNKALVKASDAITEEQFAAYLKAISAVSVDSTSYAASGKGAVTIIKNDGVIDLTAQPFSKGEGASYSLVVKATGYQDLTFTVEVPKQNGGSSGGSSSGGGGGSSSSDKPSTSKTETTTKPDGTTVKTETKADGTKVQTVTGKDGSTATVKTDKNGQTTAETKLSAKAVEDAKRNGEAVKAPVEVKASRNSSTAPTVKVELPRNSGETKVEIPVSNVKPGTVAILVHADGTEEIVKNSLPTADGIQLTVNGSATVKIMDNSKDFTDTQNHWAKDAIDFVSARGLVNGMNAVSYAPNASTTRAQLWTILARQNDADLNGGNTWFENAQNWAKEKGISDGANPNGTINRAQMVTMLWRAMGQPAAASGTSFADVPADSYYAQAVAWAIENGITAGVGGGKFDPNATCTRGQIATFLYRYMK